MNFWRRLVTIVMYVYLHIFYRIRINGLDKVPMNGAAVLCSNHIHALDSVTYGVHIKRMCYAMAKEELFSTKFKSWFMTKMGCFPVRRGAASEQAVTKAIDLLNNGELVMIFPEGTRNGIAKGVKPKKGAALIAIKAGVPIIPMGIKGSFKPFTRIEINVGEPINTSEYIKDGEVDARGVITLSNNSWNEIMKLAK